MLGFSAWELTGNTCPVCHHNLSAGPPTTGPHLSSSPPDREGSVGSGCLQTLGRRQDSSHGSLESSRA